MSVVYLDWGQTRWVDKIAQTFKFAQLFCCTVGLVVPSIVASLRLICLISLFPLEVEHSSEINNMGNYLTLFCPPPPSPMVRGAFAKENVTNCGKSP